MKVLHITVASLIAIMLVVPLAAVKIMPSVQPDTQNNSNHSSRGTGAAEDDTGGGTLAAQAGALGSGEQSFKLYKTGTGSVEELSAESYISGVVAAEMPSEYPEQALEAQAVAAFTYACYCKSVNLSHPNATKAIKGADLSDDSRSYEAYLSQDDAKIKWGSAYAAQWGKISTAVKNVYGKIVAYNGKPAETLFFAVSSGATENASDIFGENRPYLKAVASAWDKQSSDYAGTVTVSKTQFRQLVSAKYAKAKFDANPAKWLAQVKKSASGSVLRAVLAGQTVKGSDVRSLFGLKSANFDVTYANAAFTFQVRGDGHGVGMSQFGAKILASQGKNYEEILKYYYTGVQIQDFDWNF